MSSDNTTQLAPVKSNPDQPAPLVPLVPTPIEVFDGHVPAEEKVSAFLAKVIPAADATRTSPAAALVPWVCDVLQSEQSIKAYGRDLASFVSHMREHGVDPLCVTADHVKVYKRALLQSGRTPATIARALSVLRGAYRQFAEKKLIDWETVQAIAAVKAPPVAKNTTPALTEKQAVKVLHAADPTTLQGLRDRAILHTFFITACRVSALTNACVGHLEFDGTDHYLRVTEKRKKQQRKILLDAARSILDYVHVGGIHDDREGPLFRPLTKDRKSLVRKHLNRTTVWRLAKKYCFEAGVDPERLGSRGIGVHSLRKTSLNNAIENGAQMHEVRELAGHADIRTTELYFVRKEEDAERAARRIQIR